MLTFAGQQWHQHKWLPGRFLRFLLISLASLLLLAIMTPGLQLGLMCNNNFLKRRQSFRRHHKEWKCLCIGKKASAEIIYLKSRRLFTIKVYILTDWAPVQFFLTCGPTDWLDNKHVSPREILGSQKAIHKLPELDTWPRLQALSHLLAFFCISLPILHSARSPQTYEKLGIDCPLLCRFVLGGC